MKAFVILIVLASCAAAQSPKESPITFRKAYIGQPLSELVDCSSKPKALFEGYKPHGKVCAGSRGAVSRIKAHGFGGEEGEIFWVEERRVFKIVLIYQSDSEWDKVKYDLTQKMGEPLSTVPEVYQNGFGAKWEYGKGFWQSGDIIAFAGVRVANIGGAAVNFPLSNRPETMGVQVTITDAKHAKLPQTEKSSLD